MSKLTDAISSAAAGAVNAETIVAADVAAVAVDAEKVVAAVEDWFREHICKGPIAQHTPAYNQAFAAKQKLLQQLAVLFKPAPPAGQ